MLNPLSIQNLQNSAGKSLSATELVRALPLNTPTQINVRQSTPDASRPNQFTLQVQLGSQVYQLKSDQSLPPGSTATLTRTAAGQLLLSNAPSQSQTVPAGTTGTSTANTQNTAMNQAAMPLKNNSQTLAGTTATIPERSASQINSLLPLNRPVLATLSVAIRAGTGESNILATINGRTVPLTLNQALPFDGKVMLTRTSDQQVQIQPLTSPVQNQNLNNTINDALRYVLPTQQPVAGSLLKLQQLNNKTGGEKSPVNSVISSLLSLFGVKTGSAAEAQAGVQQNLLNGGLFTESNLANPGKQISSNEMKYQLNQLLQQADKLPEQARQQLQEIVKGLLNRVTSNQLESLQNTRVNSDGGLERFFALDLPVKNGEQLDNVELKISEHRRQLAEDEWQHSWRVRLHFDLEQQGTIDAELVLEDEHQVTAHFWCSQADIAETLNDKLPEFNQQLHQQGFNIQSTHCSEGAAPKAINRIEPLIDVTT